MPSPLEPVPGAAQPKPNVRKTLDTTCLHLHPKDADIRISMDGRGRWMDNVFIERLRRSLKYECIYLNAFETGSEARTGIGCWIDYCNADRPTRSLPAGRPTKSMLRKQTRRNWRRNRTQIHFSQAAILSRQAGPPLLRADWPSGNAPTTRVRRLISRRMLTMSGLRTT